MGRMKHMRKVSQVPLKVRADKVKKDKSKFPPGGGTVVLEGIWGHYYNPEAAARQTAEMDEALKSLREVFGIEEE